METILTLYDKRVEAQQNAAAEPFYTWSTYTSDGSRKLSIADGPLKLILDPLVGYRNMPNQSGPWFTISSRGYRGAEVNTSREVRRVVLLGGSTAFGTGALSDAQTFARALERKFRNVQVVNAAVIGHVSTDELSLLRTELLQLQPSLVIALDGYNDHVAFIEGHRLVNSGFHGSQEGLLELKRIKSNPLFALIAVAESCFPHLHRRTRRLGALPAWFQRRLTGRMPDDGKLGARIRLYADNLRQMAELLREKGIPFLALIQPERPQNDKMRYYNERYTYFVRSAEALLAQQGIEFMNLHALGNLRPVDFTDNIHFRATGAEIVAERVYQRIQVRHLLFELTPR